MLGFIVFAVIIVIVVIFNVPEFTAGGFASNPDPSTCKVPTVYTQRGDFDAITKANTDINSTTAITTTKMQHILKGDSGSIIESKNLRRRKPKSKQPKGKKLKFSNNVKVRLFDKKTRSIIKDDKKRL